jgi:hypothetical protein
MVEGRNSPVPHGLKKEEKEALIAHLKAISDLLPLPSTKIHIMELVFHSDTHEVVALIQGD